ncbi:MAG: dihydroorotate dehydrogenase [Christensenellales bacterium]|jgi:dihydroorotate dehydrogenase (NAD+) catalytic subunit
MVDLRVSLGALTLDNPIIPASGTFGYGHEFSALYDINLLGAFVCKGTTQHPRHGNPLPRVTETPGGMLNAVGLQNPGIEAVIKDELPRLFTYYRKPLIVNISGFSVDEYAYCCRRLNEIEQVGIIEVNVSCPNVKHGGLSFGTTQKGVAEVTKAVKKATHKPVFIKLSPNVTDIAGIARACEGEGADGISLINTLLGMRMDVKNRKPILANITGGLSGPAVLPVALRMVYDVYKAVSIPIMGMGGVSCARDVIEMMLAGACAVQVGAANLVDPYCCKQIIEELPGLMKDLGVGSLQEIVGGAHT